MLTELSCVHRGTGWHVACCSSSRVPPTLRLRSAISRSISSSPPCWSPT